MDKATIALVISVLSLFVVSWHTFRDRGRVHLRSRFLQSHPEYGPDRIWFKATNSGRRSIYLRAIGGNLSKHGWMNTDLSKTESGLKLEEGQSYEDSWDINSIFANGPDSEDEYVDIWLEDSLGKRYEIPNSKKYIKRLKASNANNL